LFSGLGLVLGDFSSQSWFKAELSGGLCLAGTRDFQPLLESRKEFLSGQFCPTK